MNHRLSLSILTIEVDGKPTLAFEAKRYSEAEASFMAYRRKTAVIAV